MNNSLIAFIAATGAATIAAGIAIYARRTGVVFRGENPSVEKKKNPARFAQAVFIWEFIAAFCFGCAAYLGTRLWK